jgi:hypothetical protein
MQPPLTAEDIWKLFRETDRRFQETDRKFQETDREIKETAREVRETSREVKETSREVKETARLVRELRTELGRLGGRLGEFVEEMIAPDVVRLFQEWQIPVHEVHRRVEAERGELEMEVDLLVVNDEAVVAVEVKSKLSSSDVTDFVERMGRFKQAFPAYRNARVMGACAAMVLPKDVARFVYRQGLFVIAQKGDRAQILNDNRFRPQQW